MEKRKYTLRERAARQDETRQRIVDAAMALHEELGPRHTTISAIAERAGVQRLTVYRHFGDEGALFGACTSGWLAGHPPPPVPDRAAAAQPADALRALFAYYRRTCRMWEMSYRDVDEVPGLHEPMRQVHRYLDAYRDALVSAWAAPRERGALRATLTLALRFRSWQVLADEGWSDAAMAGLVARWAAAAADGPPSRGARPGSR